MSEKGVPEAYSAWENNYTGRETPGRLAAFEAGASWANERAAKRIAELEAALEVFDDALGEDDPDYPDDQVATIKWGRTTVYLLTLGDLRRARAVLSQEKQHDHLQQKP